MDTSRVRHLVRLAILVLAVASFTGVLSLMCRVLAKRDYVIPGAIWVQTQFFGEAPLFWF